VGGRNQQAQASGVGQPHGMRCIADTIKGSFLLMACGVVVALVAWMMRPDGFPPAVNEPAPDPRLVSGDTVHQWTEPVLWVVMDGAQSGHHGRMEGEVIIVSPDHFEDGLADLLGKWNPGCRIVIICAGLDCDASLDLAGRLRAEVGLPDVYVMGKGVP